MSRNDDTMAAFGGCVAALVGVAALGVWGTAVEGYVVSRLWLWFVVPRFALPTLTVAQAAGLALVVQALRPNSPSVDQKKRDDVDQWVIAFGTVTLGPLLLLALGALLRQWV